MKALRIISSAAVAALLMFLLGGCASGWKAYQRGDYYTASMQAVARLRSKPNHKKARQALGMAYPLVVQNAMRKVDNALESKDLNQLDRMVTIYGDLERLSGEISTSPGALEVIPDPKNYQKELRLAKEMVAELSYQEGMKAMTYGTLEQARVALRHFLRVNEYMPGYKDIITKIGQARYAATIRVIVEKPMTNAAYTLDADFFYDRLMDDLTNRTYSDLVRFYTVDEAEAVRMTDPHEILELNFENFSVGNTRESSDSFEVKRDSVLIGTTKVHGHDQNVYGTVKARVTVYRLEILSKGILRVMFVDPANGSITRQNSFAGQSLWVSRWAVFNGDERALDNELLDLAHRRPLPLPPPQDLFASFAMPLYDKAAKYISSIY